MRQIPATHVSQFDILQVLPHSFIWIEIGSIGWQRLKMNMFCASISHVRRDLLAVDWTSIPDHQQLAAGLPAQVFEEQHAVRALQGSAFNQCVEFATHRDPAHHRQMVVTVCRLEHRSRSLRSVSLDQPRHQIESGFVNKYNQTPFFARLFLSSGQRLVRHSAIAASSRWLARSSGNCGVQAKPFSNRATCLRWYLTPNSCSITLATRIPVHTAPRNPYASAPCERQSGIKRNCSGVSFNGPRRAGLARHASRSCSSSRWLNHLHTAGGETPSACAMSHCFHPCALSSKARLRRASFQSLKEVLR